VRIVLNNLTLPPYRAYEGGIEGVIRSGVLVNYFSPWSLILFLRTKMFFPPSGVFLIVKCFVEVCLVGCRCITRFLGTVAVSSAGLAALKACELLSRLMLACSGTMVVDYFREISSDEQVLIVLLSEIWSW